MKVEFHINEEYAVEIIPDIDIPMSILDEMAALAEKGKSVKLTVEGIGTPARKFIFSISRN
jgi:hypothetical protein